MSYLDPQAEECLFNRQKEIMDRIGTSDSPCIFDVGGNIGQSIRAYREMWPQAVITSFEPQPDCFAEIQKHFGGQQGVSFECLALADTVGTLPFYKTNCPTASSLLVPDERVRKKSVKKNYDYKSIIVPVDTLDNICVRKNVDTIDILKIDVQGAELGVVKGAKGLLSGNRIRLIYVEVIFADLYQGQGELSALLTYLAGFNYSLWDMRPFLFTRAGRLWAANAIITSHPSCQALENYPVDFPFELYEPNFKAPKE
jgi:FkbM family methyltransferase